MKKCILLLFLAPMFSFAQIELWENESGVLRWVLRDSLPYTDTVLPDGTKSRLYSLPYIMSDPFIYFEFPDSVVVVASNNMKFLYPSGLEPGVYNFSHAVKAYRRDDGEIVCEPLYRFTSPEYTGNPPVLTTTISRSGSTASSATVSNFPPKQEYAPSTCTFRGKHLNGNVKIVSSNADFKVKVVENNEFLTVRLITNSSTTNLCGQWRMVEVGEDFTVQFVEYDEDFTIRMQ